MILALKAFHALVDMRPTNEERSFNIKKYREMSHEDHNQ